MRDEIEKLDITDKQVEGLRLYLMPESYNCYYVERAINSTNNPYLKEYFKDNDRNFWAITNSARASSEHNFKLADQFDEQINIDEAKKRRLIIKAYFFDLKWWEVWKPYWAYKFIS